MAEKQATVDSLVVIPVSLWERFLSLRIALSWEATAYIVILVAAAMLRFWDLGSRALHHDESLHATFSWYLYQGRGYTHMPMMHGPFQFFGNALVFFALGDSDYTARLLYAVFGTVLVGLPFFLRPYIGRVGALTAAALLAFSPTMLYFSRFARNDIYIAVWTLGMIICLWRYLDTRQHRYLYGLAALLALSFATKEVTFLTAALFIIYVDLLAGFQLVQKVQQQRELPRWAAYGLTLLLAPFAWLIVALWPLMRSLRQRLGWQEMPAIGDVLLVMGTFVLPQFAAFIQPVLEHLGWNMAEPWREVFGRHWTVEEGAGVFTVAALIVGTALVGALWNYRSWLMCAATFYSIFIVLYTSFFTNMEGFATGIWGSLDYWLAQQDVRRGGQPWFYYLMLMPVYEFLPLVFAMIGAIYYTIRGNAFTRFLAFWLAGSIFAYSMAGEKMPWLNVHLALPAIILGAYTLGRIWTQRRERRDDLPAVPWEAIVVAALAGLIGVFGPVGTFGVALRVALALVATGIIFGIALPGSFRGVPAIAAAVVVGVLLVFTVRAAWMLSFQHGDTPVEMLIYTQSSPRIPAIRNEIDDLARRTGLGYDLPITVDSTDGFSWPWAWYLRNYRRVSYPTLSPSGQPPDSAVVLASVANQSLLQQPGSRYVMLEQYPHRWWFPEGYRSFDKPTLRETLSSFWSAVKKGDTWQSWWRYFRDRKPPGSLGSVDAIFFLEQQYADLLTTPPQQ